ncbi:bifunctional folylpolyglutamate synthase/dihydrofolate synthase [Facklamia sp. P12945]|uniref:bifunctional folylpolyglutamate synthase/dihydrofolate synthase n=1 Tax=Facklamia sp. P12945 TaxID=3421950 RepID=UPI003D177D8A
MINSLTDDLPTILYGEGDRLSVLKAMLKQLGQPDQTVKIIHIAGTNGKGSTANMISHLLLAHGYRTGLFTSPHLYSECESIKVNDQMISQSDFSCIMAEVHRAAIVLGLDPQKDLSQFETTFLIGILYYAHLACDYLVLECGVGGGLDATNAISHSEYAIFTKIGMDHLNLLGDSLQAIVETKAGIIRSNQQVIVAPNQKNGVVERLKQISSEQKSSFHDSSDQKIVYKRPHYFQVELNQKSFELYLPLLGTFQNENLKTVFKWYQVWLESEQPSPIETDMTKAFKDLRMVGRFEKVQSTPDIILDAAHNLDAIQELISSIQSLYAGQKLSILCGFLKDKDVPAILDELLKLTADFYVTQPDFPDRAMDTKELAKLFEQKGSSVISYPDSRAGLKQLMEDQDDPIIVVGSFHLIKKVRDLFATN